MSVRVNVDGPVYVVTIDRPQSRNAVDRATAEQLVEAFTTFDADESVSVAVLTGSGGHFCAGADLKAIAAGKPNRVAPDGDGPMGPTRMLLSKPVIAAIEGYAVAGGLELAVWCDLRVMAADATVGVFCRRFGVPLIDGGTVRLPRIVGAGRAMDLILTGREVRADEAHDIGLCNRIAPPGKALEMAVDWAKSLANLPQVALRHDRLSAIEQWGLSEPDAIRNELNHGLVSMAASAQIGASVFAAGAGRHGQSATES